MDPPQEAIFLAVCRTLGISIDAPRLDSSVRIASEMFGPRARRRKHAPFSQERIDGFWTEYHRRVIAGCAVDPTDERRAGEVYRGFSDALGWRVYDEVRPMLDGLRSIGIAVGVISNWTGDLEDVLRKVDLHARFDVIVDSARFGHEKPHPEIFEEALRRVGVRAAHAMHVGDSVDHDVEGAIAAGLHAVLLDRDDRHAAFARVPRVRRLDEILSLV